MRTLIPMLPLLFTAACSDYDFTSDEQTPGPPNPPVPENPIQLDRVVQDPVPEVDVLFVIDNSCSMEEEQAALSDNFPAFMDFFLGSGLDYHIGVVSTDMTDPTQSGKLRQAAGHRFIDRDTPNPLAVFSQMALMGTDGDTTEAGRAAAYTALELRRDGPRNEGFYRDEAALHMIFVSDEEDSSGSTPVSRREFRLWMESTKITPDLVKAHAVIWQPGQTCADGWSPGAEYQRYVDWSGGVAFNICEQEWGGFLEELGLQTAGLKREFFLSKIPVIPTIDVKVVTPTDSGETAVVGYETCDEGCPTQYVRERNSIAFVEGYPPPMSVVEVRYNMAEQWSAGGVDEQTDTF